MIEKARRKKVYDDLAEGDLAEWLAARPGGSADLVLAADVFIYVADIAPVFAEAVRLLAKDGLFAFTVQTHEGRGAVLGEDLRYAQAEPYVAELAERFGFRIVVSEPCVIREDRGRPVMGRVFVLAR